MFCSPSPAQVKTRDTKVSAAVDEEPQGVVRKVISRTSSVMFGDKKLHRASSASSSAAVSPGGADDSHRRASGAASGGGSGDAAGEAKDGRRDDDGTGEGGEDDAYYRRAATEQVDEELAALQDENPMAMVLFSKMKMWKNRAQINTQMADLREVV